MKYKYKVENVVFETLSEAFDYCDMNDISEENLELLEEETLSEEDTDLKKICEENPDDPRCKEYYEVANTDEEPSEEGAMTEKDYLDSLRAKVIVDNWKELSDTEKKMVLSRMLGKETGQDKVFKRKETKLVDKASGRLESSIGEPLAKYHLQGIIDSIEGSACPFCGEHLSQFQFFKGVDLPENLAKFNLRKIPKFKDAKKLPKPFDWKSCPPELKPKLVVQHIRSRHQKLYKLLYDVFNQFKWIADVPSAHLQPQSETHHLSEEKLSKEELAEEIGKSPELRKQFYRKWLESLQEKH